MLSAPLPANETERQQALESLDVLDTPADPYLDALTRLARDLFGVKTALISLIDNERQWFKSRQGLEVAETPRAVSFCAHAILQDTPLVVEDGIEAGQTYMVQVQLDGYEAWSSQYEARAGAPVSQIAVLVPIRVDVTVRTEPAGGQVWVDGVDHGTSPVTLQRLPVGRELRLRAQVEGREVRETRPVPTEGGEIVLSP